MQLYWIWFAQLKNLSLWQKKQLLASFLDPQILYEAGESDLPEVEASVLQALQDKDLTQAQEILALCKDQSIGIVTYADAQYPPKL